MKLSEIFRYHKISLHFWMNWTILHTVYDDVSLLNFKEAASLALVNTPLLVSVQDLRRGSTARGGQILGSQKQLEI